MKTHDSTASQKPIRVTFFHRKPRALGNFSIELYFQQIRKYLPKSIEPIYVEMPFYSNGIFKRFCNMLFCFFKQGDINHITGDILYVAILLNKHKTILTIHDCVSLQGKKGISLFINKLFWYILPIRNSTLIIANSEATKNDIQFWMNNYNLQIEIIHICISQNFKPKLKIFNDNNPRILQIGTAPNKNVKNLLFALQGIQSTLVVIGKLDQETTDLANKLQINVVIIDRRLTEEEIITEYHNCDILCLTSTLEGFGMPIIEANTIGRAVITSNISSMPEIAGNAALLVNPFEIKSIKMGILSLITNPILRDSLIQKGLMNQARFNAETLAKKHSHLYHQIFTKNKYQNPA